MERIFCGIDFHKNESVICAVFHDGTLVMPIRKIKSASIFTFFSDKTGWELGIEASGGTNHLVTKLREMGLKVTLINSNQFRGIGIGGKKTDQRDAKALADCLRVGFAPEVHVKTLMSRQLKSLVVNRELVVTTRTRMMSHVRGTLKEYGMVIPVGVDSFYKQAPGHIANLENGFLKSSMEDTMEFIRQLTVQQKTLEQRLKEFIGHDPKIERLKTIPGVGDMVSVMAVCVCDNVGRFKNGNQFASYIGLVPRVHASAETRMMGHITRSGSEILRRYLIHGARVWMRYAPSGDPNRAWAEKVKNRRGMNKATVALAHRMARIIFAVLRDETEYTGKRKKKQMKRSDQAVA
jgi:transposase